MQCDSGDSARQASRSNAFAALRRRIVTAAILIPLVLGTLFFLPTAGVAVVFGAFIALGAWEWSYLAGWSAFQPRVYYTIATSVCMAAAYWLLSLSWVKDQMAGGALLLLGGWCAAFYWLLDYQRRGIGIPKSRPLLCAAGLFVVVPGWAALIGLHGRADGGVFLVVALMLVIWSADIGAFFAGKRWGKHRLADKVSPGKTWEGLWGGLAASGAVGWLCSGWIPLRFADRVGFMTLCLATVIFSVLGDLFESLVKRQAGVKDSGSLLPGHGGILDRIDSLMAAAPVFALGTAVGLPL